MYRVHQYLTLNGDEVGAALVGDCLGEERLTATRGAVEQRPLRSAHAELLELVSVLNRVLSSPSSPSLAMTMRAAMSDHD